MIANYEDIIDSRDVIARIEQLQAIRQPGPVPEGILDPEDVEALNSLFHELSALEALAAEGEFLADWQYGATLIRDSCFQEYAEELAEDIGAVDRDARWPLNHIDWEAAADELKQDYTAINFDGITYWAKR